jgi:hypothetical protein
MRRLSLQAGAMAFIAALVISSFCFTALAAEKKKFSLSTKREKWVSENLLEAYGDRSQIRMDFQRYVLKQGVHLDIVSESTEPDLIGAEQTLYWQMDRVVGHPLNERGITVTRTKNGEYLYSKWESTMKLKWQDMANWEGDSEIRFQFLGGTGKYSDLRGGGTCIGKRTPKEDAARCEGELEY